MLGTKQRLLELLRDDERANLIHTKKYRLNQLKKGCPVFNQFLLTSTLEAKMIASEASLFWLNNTASTLNQMTVITLESTLNGLVADLQHITTRKKLFGPDPDKMH